MGMRNKMRVLWVIAVVLASVSGFAISRGLEPALPVLPVSEETLDYVILAMETARDAHRGLSEHPEEYSDPSGYISQESRQRDAKWAEIYDDVLTVLKYVKQGGN